MAKALPIFETAAVALEVGDHIYCWDGLKWLCLLNEIDPDETATALRGLSAKISCRQPEQGVHPDIPKRIAALLLWLTGQENDEDAAASIDPGIDRRVTYEKDYLPQPGQSWFPLERRHAQSVLADAELSLHDRVQRTTELWLDPNFEPPASFVKEVRAVAARIDVEKLNRSGSRTLEDYDFERLEPVLARCASDLLADLTRRKMRSMATCPPESRHWSAIHATEHLVLAGEAEVEAARKLRLSGGDGDDDVFNKLLLMEIRELNVQAQFDELIHADLESISVQFAKVLRPPTPDDVDALIARYADGPSKQQRNLLILLSIYRVELTDKAWSWVESFANHCGFGSEQAFLALCEALLVHDSERGAQLWKTLHRTMIMRYIGAAGVEELLHIVFRVPDSPAATALRDELAGLEYCHTDQALFNLAIATAYNGKGDWLASFIKQDQASKFTWRRKRASVLAGFTVNNALPVEDAWPDGESKTGYADLARKSARFRWTEACPRHWWRTYLEAPDPTEAYAAWVLFMRSSDRRCRVWMNQAIEATQESDDFFKLKMIHARLNQGQLKNSLKKHEDKLDKSFLDRRIFAGVGLNTYLVRAIKTFWRVY